MTTRENTPHSDHAVPVSASLHDEIRRRVEDTAGRLTWRFTHGCEVSSSGGNEHERWDGLFKQVEYLIDDLARKAERAEAAEHALTEIRASLEWKPIASAPKDGTPILIARHIEPFGWIRGYATYQQLSRLGGGWISRGFGVFGELGLGDPTHWQPIPDPPAVTLAGISHQQEQKKD